MRLTVETALNAYRAGIFPMSESATSDSVFWVEPVYRGILPLDRLLISTSLAKAIRRDDYEIRINHNFEAVIAACATARKADKETWINANIRNVYGELFKQGICHTVEVYRKEQLIGGLYGLALGAAFFGESMFHKETNASKIALTFLVARLKVGGFKLLDTQFITPHLESLGAIEIKQSLYKLILNDCLNIEAHFNTMPQNLKGRDILELMQ